MPTSPAHRRAAGELESAVLKALWDADAPLTPTEIRSRISPDLAYNTVHTVLTRMCDKGLLHRTRVAGRPAYVAALASAEHGAARLHAVLQAADDRVALLRHFVADGTDERRCS
jgi:predicted transcriptional regulator